MRRIFAAFKRTPTDAMSLIARAADGLLFSSESDYALTPFTWNGSTQVTPDLLRTAAGMPSDTPVNKVDIDSFFAPMLRLPENPSSQARTRVARFQKLVGLLRKNLSDLAVYKLGAVEMPTFVVGRLPNGSLAGLRTTVVET